MKSFLGIGRSKSKKKKKGHADAAGSFTDDLDQQRHKGKVKKKTGIEAILEKLEKQHFFHVTETQQLKALDGLNKFITSKTNLNKALEMGMLDVVTDLVKLANDYNLLPVPHARIMELVQTLVAIPTLKVKFGVEANLCAVLVGEISELNAAVLDSVQDATIREREETRQAQLKKKEAAGGTVLRKRAVNFMEVYVSGDQPIGITVGVPTDKPKGGIVGAIMEGSQVAAASPEEWAEVAAERAAERAEVEAEGASEEKTAEEIAEELRRRRTEKKERESRRRKQWNLGKDGKHENQHVLVGDEIMKIGDNDVTKLTNAQIQKKLEKAKRPVSVYYKGLRDLSQIPGVFWKEERKRLEKLNEQDKDARFLKKLQDKEKAQKKAVADKERADKKADRKKRHKAETKRAEREGMDFVYEVSFSSGPLGLVLKEPANKGVGGCIVQEVADGGQAAKMGTIKPGHRPLRVAGELVTKMKIAKILKLIKKAPRPLAMKLKGREKLKQTNEKFVVKFYPGPMGLKLVQRSGVGPLGDGVAVAHLQENGYAQRTGDVEVGHIVNAFIVPKHKPLTKRQRAHKEAMEEQAKLGKMNKQQRAQYHKDKKKRAKQAKKEAAKKKKKGHKHQGSEEKEGKDAGATGADSGGKVIGGVNIVQMQKEGGRIECRHKKLQQVLVLIKEMPRPCHVEFLVPDLHEELFAAQKWKEEQERIKAEEERIRKEPSYTVTLHKKPHGIVLEPAWKPEPTKAGEKPKKRKGGCRLKAVMGRSEGAKLKPRPVRQGDRLISINGKKVEKRPLGFCTKELRAMSYPATLELFNDTLQKVIDCNNIALGPLEKRVEVPEDHEHPLESTWEDLEDYDMGMSLVRIPGRRNGAQVQAVADRGDAKTLGVQRDWQIERICGVECQLLSLLEIRDLLANAVRPFVIDFNVVTLKGLKKTKALKAATANPDGAKQASKGLLSKLAKNSAGGAVKKKLNLRSLLWTAAPKAMPQPPLSAEAELMVELIPEYLRPLSELIKNEKCKIVTATDNSFEVLAEALRLFVTVKSRSEDKIRPSILNILTRLTDFESGLRSFVGVEKLVRTWCGFLWDAQSDPKVLHDLITQLHRVAHMDGILEHGEYQPVFVARSVVNLLNASHGTLLRDSSGAGPISYSRLVEILTGILNANHRLLMEVLNAFYHKPGIPGLWNMLLKCKTPGMLLTTMRMLRLVTVDRNGKLYSSYSDNERPRSVGETPHNVLHMLIMAMNRAKLNTGGFEFEYEFQEGSIGLKLDVAPGKRSGTVVKGVAPDSQADRAGIIESGDIVLRIGKRNVEKFPLDRCIETLKNEPRPVMIEFRKPNTNDGGAVADHALYTLRFDSGPMGMKLVHLSDQEPGARIQFIEADTQAATHPQLKVGHIVYKVGQKQVDQLPYDEVLKALRSARRPLQLTFCDPISRSPEEVRADEITKDILMVITRVMAYDHELEEEMELVPERAPEIKSFHTFHELSPSDAMLILELVFARMLRRPTPPPAMCEVCNQALLLCARADYVTTSALYVPAFMHLNHLDEGEADPDYNVAMITGMTQNVMRIIDECDEICLRIARAGGIAVALRSFNRLRDAAEKGEAAELTTLENGILHWNTAMLDLLVEMMPHRDPILDDILADNCPAIIANLFEVALVCETVHTHEKERLLRLVEDADEDGDGSFDVERDNPAFAEGIQLCDERVKLLQKMEAVVYTVRFSCHLYVYLRKRRRAKIAPPRASSHPLLPVCVPRACVVCPLLSSTRSSSRRAACTARARTKYASRNFFLRCCRPSKTCAALPPRRTRRHSTPCRTCCRCVRWTKSTWSCCLRRPGPLHCARHA